MISKEAAQYLAEEKYDEAIAIYQQCIENYPIERDNYWRLGLVYLLQGKESLAQELWWSIMLQGTGKELETWTVELIDLLDTEATNLQAISKFPQAEIIYRQILEFNPELPKIYNKLGNILLAQNQFEAALSSYEQAINLDPDFFMAYNNQGIVFEKQNQFESALICYQKATEIDPNIVQPYYNMGVVFEQQGKLEEAIEFYQKAIKIDPNHAKSYHNMGMIVAAQGELVKGIDFCNQAIKINPNWAQAHRNLGMILLKMGEFERGFTEYEWRIYMKENQPRSFPQPLWDGSNLADRTILLHAEQGFGDTIQFIRYAPMVKAGGGMVVFECQQPLFRLLINCPGIDQVVPRGADLPQFDVHVPLMSLPRIFGTTLTTVPQAIPYLSVKEPLNLKLEMPKNAKLKVGIVWAGSPTNKSDRYRSCSLQDFQALFHIPNIAFFSLQKGPPVTELAQFSSDIIQDLSPVLGDFADTAEIISQLDLVITVDTAVAHLTGALGKPVWLLLCFAADWRWLLEREDSPWYPSMRLFRQEHLGDWVGVFAQVIIALQKITT